MTERLWAWRGYGEAATARRDGAVDTLGRAAAGRIRLIVWCSGVRTNFTEDERTALAAFLRDSIAADRFPMSPRWRPIKSALAKIRSATRAAASPAAETAGHAEPGAAEAAWWTPMSSSGAVTLGEIAGKITMLEIACDRCERRGRLRVARLIEQHGADMGLPQLRGILAGDCPRVAAVSTMTGVGCGVLAGASSRCTTGLLPTRAANT